VDKAGVGWVAERACCGAGGEGGSAADELYDSAKHESSLLDTQQQVEVFRLKMKVATTTKKTAIY